MVREIPGSRSPRGRGSGLQVGRALRLRTHRANDIVTPEGRTNGGLQAGSLGREGRAGIQRERERRFRERLPREADRNGNPMRADLPGMARRRLLLSDGTGFHSRLEGERRRKMTRGNEVTPDLVQINAVVTAYGEKPLGEYFKKGEEKPAEKEGQAPKERPAKKK